MHPHCDCLIKKHKKTCPYRVPPVEPPVAPQRDGNRNEVVVVDDSDNEVASVQPAVAATTASPADALALAGIKPYETALGQGVESARDDVANSESALQDVAARSDAETAAITSFEATIAEAQARIREANQAIKNAEVKMRTPLSLRKQLYREQTDKQNLLDQRRNSLRRLESTSVPPPGLYQELVPKNGELTGFDIIAKVDEIVKKRSAKDSEIYAGISNSRKGLDNRFKSHKGRINDKTTMLVIYFADTAKEIGAFEAAVINHCHRQYGKVGRVSRDLEEAEDEGRCANKVAGGGGARPSPDPTEKHYLYFLFEAAAKRPGE